jgi:tetratricopeptide (TPR) repeat protein
MENSYNAKTPPQLEKDGGVAYQRGEYKEAARIFAAAEGGYKLKGDIQKSAEMANNRCVALLRANQAEAALEAVDDTIEIFRSGHDERLLAMALGNRASAYEALRRYSEAFIDYEASAEILKEIGEQDLRLNVMKSLSALQLRSGRSLEALATMQAGVNGVDKPGLTHRLIKKLLKMPGRLLGK